MPESHPIELPVTVKDLTGQRFGRLLVASYAGKHRKRHKWNCVCDCGNLSCIDRPQLTGGKSVSCGCYKKELLSRVAKTHGMCNSAEYHIYRNMLARCHNEKNTSFPGYGGRGITVCDRWMESFENFYADMGSRPSKIHSIDRINNDGNYEPGNVKWSTPSQQTRNCRHTKKIFYKGESKLVMDWAAIFGIDRHVLYYRIRNKWSPEKTLETPVGRKMKFISRTASSVPADSACPPGESQDPRVASSPHTS